MATYTTYYAAFLRPGSLWDSTRTAREQPFWDDHARYMDALFETGIIILGGPFADRTGSLVIVKADVIFTLKDGRIVESGAHEQLLAQGGLYAHLYADQFRNGVENY